MLSEVTVILGDPRLPDLAKPDRRFTREDFEAIDRMKTALSHLRDTRFTYLDNHQLLCTGGFETKQNAP